MMASESERRRVAIVFGGSRGIGAAIAGRLAADRCAVALTYLGSAGSAEEVVDAIRGRGGEAIALYADSADPSDVRCAVQETVARFGLLDVAVVNAGIIRLGAIETFAVEDFNAMFNVNVRGVLLSIQAAVPSMRNGGRVITIGSNTAIRVGSSQGGIYAMTKAAVASLIKALAQELAPRGITANNVQPGPTATDMTAGKADYLVKMIPLRRIGQPSEVAALVSYLASEEAGFVTGESVTIDGGYVL
jgi:3-oxoacyl-[acyl-carrier protein] reductase